jgi:hypothetical protein
MAFVKMEKVMAQENIDRQGQAKMIYHQIGELLTYKADGSGKTYQKLKLFILPGLSLGIFPAEERKPSNA